MPESMLVRISPTNSVKPKQKESQNFSTCCLIQIMAPLFFQNLQKEWVIKTVQGRIRLEIIKDWDTALELE